MPGSLTLSPTITPAQSGLDSATFADRRLRAFNAARASSVRVTYSYSRSHAAGSGQAEASLWIGEGVTKEGPVNQSQLNGQLGVLDDAGLVALRAANGGGLSPTAKKYHSVRASRESGAWTGEEAAEFNGFIGTDAGLRPLRKPVSNSALELFTTSPQLFFLERVLGGHMLKDQDASLDIESTERGDIYHQIFENFVSEVWLNNAARPERYYDIDWDGAVSTIDRIAGEVLASRRSDRTNATIWKAFAEQVVHQCHVWLEKEQADAANGWDPVAVELGFGVDHAKSGQPADADHSTALELPLNNGQELKLAGFIDRVDISRNADGTINVRVTDYKSGRGSYSAHIKQDSPTGDEKKGYKFQLAIYGELIRAAAGLDGPAQPQLFPQLSAGERISSVSARYWFFLDQKDEFVEVSVSDKVHATLVDNLTNIYDLVSSGWFPAVSLEERTYMAEQLKRLGRTNYEASAEALAERAITPLPITTPAAESSKEAK